MIFFERKTMEMKDLVKKTTMVMFMFFILAIIIFIFKRNDVFERNEAWREAHKDDKEGNRGYGWDGHY